MAYRILKDYQDALMMVEDVLGAGSTNNIQITKLCKHLFGNDYLGTYSSDKMPKGIKDNQCFILNTDSSKSLNKYGHWVGFYKLNGKLFYYDSFGRPAYKLSKYWANKRMINTNKNGRDQSFSSKICGSISVSWLILIKKWGERAIGVI